MDKSAIAFAVLSILAVVGIGMVAYPYAAMTPEQTQMALNPQPAEMFDDVDLGDFGSVSVLDMMQHYLDNPPAQPDGPVQKSRFQGC